MCEFCAYQARAYLSGFDVDANGNVTVFPAKPGAKSVGPTKKIIHPHVVPEPGGTANQVGGPTLFGVLPTGKGATDPFGAIIGQQGANQIYSIPNNIEKNIGKALADANKGLQDTLGGGLKNIQQYVPIILAGGLALVAIYVIAK